MRRERAARVGEGVEQRLGDAWLEVVVLGAEAREQAGEEVDGEVSERPVVVERRRAQPLADDVWAALSHRMALCRRSEHLRAGSLGRPGGRPLPSYKVQ